MTSPRTLPWQRLASSSQTPVKTHVTHIFQKLQLRDRVQAVVLAYRTRLLEGETGALGTNAGPPDPGAR